MADSTQSQNIALRKRQQISKASRTMFLWVAIASVVVSASSVLLIQLGKKLIFNEQVLAEKSKTIDNLTYNNGIVEQLRSNLRVRNAANTALSKLQTPADDEPLQVILDALPSTANSAAVGASLQSPELLARPGVKITALTVEPVAGIENATAAEAVAGSSTAGNVINFSFSVEVSKSSAGTLKDLLQRLERSIRATTVLTLKVDQQASGLTMSVTGVAYYEPAMQVQLIDKKVP